MGFLTKLGKGFISSAVNQVGRDGGKVISNRLYGDAHATPVRRVGEGGNVPIDEGADANEKVNNNTDNGIPKDKADALEKGFDVVRDTGVSVWLVLLWIFFYIPCCTAEKEPVPFLLLFFVVIGLMKYNKKTMTAVKKVQEVKIVPDRRYRRGYRTDGYMTRTYKYKIPAGVDDIAFYKKSAIRIFVMAGVPVLGMMIYNYIIKFILN